MATTNLNLRTGLMGLAMAATGIALLALVASEADATPWTCTFAPDDQLVPPSDCPIIVGTATPGTTLICPNNPPPGDNCMVELGDTITIMDEDDEWYQFDDEDQFGNPCNDCLKLCNDPSGMKKSWAGKGKTGTWGSGQWQWCWHRLIVYRNGDPFIDVCVTKKSATALADEVVTASWTWPTANVPMFTVDAFYYNYTWSKGTEIWANCNSQPVDQEGIIVTSDCYDDNILNPVIPPEANPPCGVCPGCVIEPIPMCLDPFGNPCDCWVPFPHYFIPPFGFPPGNCNISCPPPVFCCTPFPDCLPPAPMSAPLGTTPSVEGLVLGAMDRETAVALWVETRQGATDGGGAEYIT